MNKVVLIIMTTIFMTGCQVTSTVKDNSIKKKVENAFVKKSYKPKQSYLKILPIPKVSEIINFNSNSMNLKDLLNYSLPSDITIKKTDSMVDLSIEIDITAESMDIDEYLDKVFSKTEYEYRFSHKDRVLEITLMTQKTWDLSAFLANTKTTASIGGSGLTSSSSKDVDKWESIISAAKTILEIGSVSLETQPNTPEPTKDTKQQATDKPIVTPPQNSGIRVKEWMIEDKTQAILTAYAKATKIKRLDKYISKLNKMSKTQVQMEIKAFEVTLTEDSSSGINWKLFDSQTDFEGLNNYATAGIASSNGIAPALTAITEGQIGMEIGAKIGRVGVSAILNFLKKHGEVHLVTEPTITVLNGGTAFLSSGDKISYNSGFETITVEGSSPIVYPKSSQVDIGTNIALTPNITDDGKIVIDVLATLTSLKKMQSTLIAQYGMSINNPEIAVQEISTQVIAQNGESVRLGGLIVQRLTTDKSKAPFENEILSKPFDSGYRNMEKRELVIIITPKIINHTNK